jgi:hypothetical protein
MGKREDTKALKAIETLKEYLEKEYGTCEPGDFSFGCAACNSALTVQILNGLKNTIIDLGEWRDIVERR